jgi:hypothetical protein
MLRRLAIGVATVALVALLPTGATAEEAGPHPRFAFRMPAFRVAGTKGFTIDVWAEAHGDRGKPEVFVSIWKRHVQTIYAVPGVVGPDGFSASFRHYGWVDVHYAPGPLETVKDCRGKPQKTTGGRFTGTFEFHGEWQFTEADYPRLDVRPLSGYAEGCSWVSTRSRRGAVLSAYSWAGTTEAVQNRPGGKVRFLAHDEEAFGALRIYRYLEAVGPAKDFIWDPRFRSARITPPAPFHGAASFRASRRRSNWRGNLTVDFPGFRGFPLTLTPTAAFLEAGSCEIHASHRPQPPIICS